MCTLPFGCRAGEEFSVVYQARRDIQDILTQQEAAWNAGDMKEFMKPYLRSRSLTFSSGGRVTRGWEETLERYRERYPTAEQMGKLKLDRIEIDVLNDKAALVLGHWYLRRDDGTASGAFTLVFRKKFNKWVIIHDHTSADAQNSEVLE